jgi:transaldolase
MSACVSARRLSTGCIIEDAMATEKLDEGIRKFNSDAQKLEEYALSQVAKKTVA